VLDTVDGVTTFLEDFFPLIVVAAAAAAAASFFDCFFAVGVVTATVVAPPFFELLVALFLPFLLDAAAVAAAAPFAPFVLLTEVGFAPFFPLGVSTANATWEVRIGAASAIFVTKLRRDKSDSSSNNRLVEAINVVEGTLAEGDGTNESIDPNDTATSSAK